jgi:hypothetical protein
LPGGKQKFKIVSAKKVSAFEELQSSLSGRERNIIVTNDIKVTSDITIPASKTVLLGRGIKLTAAGGTITNNGRITNITAATYICKSAASKTPASIKPFDDVVNDPNAESEQEVVIDAAVNNSQQLNPDADEAEFNTGMNLKMESDVEVSDYSDILPAVGSNIYLAPGATMIIGGQHIFGNAEDGALMTLSAFEGYENEPAAELYFNGDREVITLIDQEVTVNSTARDALSGFRINVCGPFNGETGSAIWQKVEPRINFSSVDVIPEPSCGGFLVHRRASCYIGNEEIYGPADDDAVFTMLEYNIPLPRDSHFSIMRFHACLLRRFDLQQRASCGSIPVLQRRRHGEICIFRIRHPYIQRCEEI